MPAEQVPAKNGIVFVSPETTLVFDLEEYAPGRIQLNPPDPHIREKLTPEEYRRQLDLSEHYVRRTYSPSEPHLRA